MEVTHTQAVCARLATFLFSLLFVLVFNAAFSSTATGADDLGTLIETCNQGAAKSCDQAAKAYLDGEVTEQDPRRAVDFFTKACTLGHYESCAAAGHFFLMGRNGVERDEERAIKYLKIGCDHDNLDSCNLLASAYYIGDTITPNHPAALKLYQKACEAGHQNSCGNLASLLIEGGDGVPPDPGRAFELLGPICETGASMACTNLAALYFMGKGTTQNAEKAVDLWERSCSDGEGLACRYLVQVHESGDPGTQDKKAAIGYMKMGCNAGDVDACYHLHSLYNPEMLLKGYEENGLVVKDDETATQYLRKACDGGHELSCEITDLKKVSARIRETHKNSNRRFDPDPTPFKGKLTNTVWAGPDNDGGEWFYSFVKGGQLCYREPGYAAPNSDGQPVYMGADRDGFICNGTWKQDGNSLEMEANNRAVVFEATIENSQINGTARSTTSGSTWSWKAKKLIRRSQ